MAALFEALWNFSKCFETMIVVRIRSNITVMNDRIVRASVEGKAVFVLANQMIFFMLCDWWYKEQRITSLYCLLFYNVISYLVTYVKEFLTSRTYTPYVLISENANVRHLAMTATKMVLDLTRAVTFMITGVFMLLVFFVHQGLDTFNPTWTYVFLTAGYYMLTEPSCTIYISSLIHSLQLDVLESLEGLWAPVILFSVQTTVSSLVFLFSLMPIPPGWFVVLLAGYMNVYVGFQATRVLWKILECEKLNLKMYRYASRRELSKCDDVCSICLQTMWVARITPCNHFFHSDCLRLSIRQQNVCPMCKRQF